MLRPLRANLHEESRQAKQNQIERFGLWFWLDCSAAQSESVSLTLGCIYACILPELLQLATFVKLYCFLMLSL